MSATPSNARCGFGFAILLHTLYDSLFACLVTHVIQYPDIWTLNISGCCDDGHPWVALGNYLNTTLSLHDPREMESRPLPPQPNTATVSPHPSTHSAWGIQLHIILQ